ncbi:MAG: hypothetical protein A2W04_09560 [Betaproteobacteria bacterium RBG_16_64_9]|nr:MAG: hypothetical protein A2W04_09560 [Betaproteobacteria bacterium RBG_16_64_9]OGA30515.1 MAG: hypothetical protein A3I01_19870 [Betaproteobacteria bacterium RIFCSPLOWO2_02_FULL_65_24]OGA31621.1 MAG: hypothetical protein A3G80_10280 [Betaproteobacteria bacterium RIFCSPLOWO2_12_FULL_62_13b]
MNPDAGRRALDASDDLVDSLRLAHSAVQRIENELYGAVLKDADNVSQSLHRVRQSAEQLRAEVEQFVREAHSSTSRPTDLHGSGTRPAH